MRKAWGGVSEEGERGRVSEGGPVVKQFFILCSSSDPSHSYYIILPLSSPSTGLRSWDW